MEEKFHESVLLKEATEYLNIKPGEKYIDATVGGGGHSLEILKQEGVLLGLDVDPAGIEYFKEKLIAAGWKVKKRTADRGYILTPPFKFAWPEPSAYLVQTNFKDIDKVAEKLNFRNVSGIIFDLGVSSYQLKSSGRGFSFLKDEPLDMRMDPTLKVTASDLVNNLNQEELNALFSKLGEEHLAGRYSAAICRARRIAYIKKSKQLAEIIEREAPKRWRLHPATKIFLSLRLAVNDELENLKQALPKAVKLLNEGGRLVIISFHSLEDREAKKLRLKKNLRSATRKIIVPSEGEIKKNPQSRSAKMRVYTKF